MKVKFGWTGVEGKRKKEGDETIHEKDFANLDVFELSQTFPWRQVFSKEPWLCVTWVTDASWSDCFLWRKSFTFCRGLDMFFPALYASTC